MGGLAQNVQKTPPGKNVQKSQGQIFQEFVECVECQECQGQMPRSNGKNPKVKYFRNFRNAKVKNAKVKCQGQMLRSGISGMCGMSEM